MAIPRIIVSGQYGARELGDDVHSSVGYEGVRSLFEPPQVRQAATVDTFDGPVRILAQATNYPPRNFALNGYLRNLNGRAEAQRAAHDFFHHLEGPGQRIQSGSLYLDVDLAPVKYDRFTDHDKVLGWQLEGQAIDPHWICLYGEQVGVTQGIPVIDDRLDNVLLQGADVDANGAMFTWSNPGSAPTYLTLTISGLAASTTYYLRNVDRRSKRKVVFSTGSGQTVKYLGAAYRIVAYPGTNTYRLENSAGTLFAAGPYATSMYGTKIRYVGNDADKFEESLAVFSHYRRGVAFALTAATTLTSSGDNAARIGLPNAAATAYAASKAGLVLEGSSTNLLLRSEEFDNTTSWVVVNWTGVTRTANTTEAPDGYTTADTIATTGGGDGWIRQQVTISGATANRPYSFGIYVQGSGTVRTQIIESGGASAAAETANSSNVTLSGTWQFIALTGYVAQNDRTTIEVRIRGTNPSSLILWGAQLEQNPFCTSYIATTSATVTRNADYCAVAAPHNYLKYSRDLTQTGTWVLAGSSTTPVSRAGTGADGTTSNTVTIGNIDNTLLQTVTPDVRPSDSAWRVVGSFKQGTLTGADSFDLELQDQDGATLGVVNILGSSLDADDFRTFVAEIDAGDVTATTTGFKIGLAGNTGTGTVIVDWIGLFQGDFPGRCVITEGSNIPLPGEVWEWPDYITQNGYVQFKIVTPPLSTGLSYGLFGDLTNSHLLLWRDTSTGASSHAVAFNRKYVDQDDAEQHSRINSGTSDTLLDGALHTVKLEWANYTLNGSQAAYQRLYIDGVQVAEATFTSINFTEWVTPTRLWLSDGGGNGVFATIRDLTFGVPTLPAGAIPYQVV